MRPTRKGVRLPIDPERPLGWVLLELMVCIGRAGRTWMRAHPRSTAATVAALGTWLGIEAANQFATTVVQALTRIP